MQKRMQVGEKERIHSFVLDAPVVLSLLLPCFQAECGKLWAEMRCVALAILNEEPATNLD